jgi:hypothetical protein
MNKYCNTESGFSGAYSKMVPFQLKSHLFLSIAAIRAVLEHFVFRRSQLSPFHRDPLHMLSLLQIPLRMSRDKKVPF